MFKRKKVGLALGGGGARGMAHIGVLKVLEDYKIPIDMIAGTSIGAVIGALYSAEPNAKLLEKEAISTNWKNLFDYTLSKRGIIKGNKLYDFFKERFKGVEFKDLKIPLYITSFDLEEQREVIFSKGDLAKSIRSSISIPGVFFPAENDKRILVDGSITDIIPCDVLRKKGADIIIAVNVEDVKEKKTLYDQKATKGKRTKDLPNALEAMTRALHIMQCEKCKSELLEEKADLVISPNVEGIDLLDFSKTEETIKRGERKAKQSLEKLKKLTDPNPFKELFNYLNQEVNVKKLMED